MAKKRPAKAEPKVMTTAAHHKRLVMAAVERRKKWREYQQQRRVKQAAANAAATKARETERAARNRPTTIGGHKIFIHGQKRFIKSLDDTDMVNHPPHYRSNGVEVIDVIEAFKLNYNLANAIKYILRADRKGKRLEDLKKAAWYLTREIEASGK